MSAHDLTVSRAARTAPHCSIADIAVLANLAILDIVAVFAIVAILANLAMTADPKSEDIKKPPGSCGVRRLRVAVTYSPAFAVPLARRGLTSLFGMGRGGAPALSPP